jgi:hypothetical protein
LAPQKKFIVRFALSESFFPPIEIHHQFIQVLSGEIMGMQHIWKWYIELKNSRMDVRDDDHTGQHITSGTGYSRSGGLILVNYRVAVSELSAAL